LFCLVRITQHAFFVGALVVLLILMAIVIDSDVSVMLNWGDSLKELNNSSEIIESLGEVVVGKDKADKKPKRVNELCKPCGS
jgi:hypothetical protein